MIRRKFVATILGFAVALGSFVPSTLASDVSFYKDVRPILQARCQGCHQPAKANGAYVLTSVESILKQGESERPGVVPGKPDASFLIEQITPHDGVAAMPQEGEPLAPAEIELLSQWIAEGARDDTPPSAVQTFDADHPPRYARPPVVTSLDISPDGSLVAVAGFHEVVLHPLQAESAGGDELERGVRPAARLVGMSERIASVAFSPDGAKLAVTGGLPARMGEVQIWDVASHELELSLPVTFDTVYGASWSPDGKLLAFGCADNSVRAIEAATGRQVLFQGAHSDWALDTVFSADGSHLASVGRDATAKLIEVATERFVDNITSITPGALRGGIHAVARHPERDEILFGGADGVPKIYRMHRTTKRVIGDDANLLWQLPSLPGRVFSVDYSDDGRVIAACSSLDGSGAVHLYQIEPNPHISDEINAILVKPTHTRSAEENAKLQAHFDAGIRLIRAASFSDGGIYAVAISQDASRVVAAGANGKVRVFNATSGDLVREFVPVELTDGAETTETRAKVAQAAESDDDNSQHGAAALAASSLSNLSKESLPDGAEVVRLSIEPAAIVLDSPTSYAQVVVSAELVGGDVLDVTRQACLHCTATSVAVSATGFVQATADGESTLTATLAGKSAEAAIIASGTTAPLRPDFVADVSPILARAGCNAGTCHGAQDGKNGFKLSLRGYDPLFDVRALADDLASRRTDLASPVQSLMLLKPTASVPHEGGQAIAPGSDSYRTLLAWVEEGAQLRTDSPRVVGIVATPINPIVQSIGSRQQMRVTATYSDGRTRDVTREAFVESGDTEIAKPVAGFAGLIEVVRRGEAPILVRYEGAYAATTVTVMGDRSGFVWQEPPANNAIDDFVHEKLKRTKTAPSPLCDDYAFLRRVSLDLTGLPPMPDEIDAFLGDRRDSQWKRNDLIDRLIGSPDYVEHWTNKWADLLQVNGAVLGREGAEALRNWIRAEIKANRPYDDFAREILTATGSTKENPPASYYKTLRDPQITMENTTHLFLATRFNCNKCHDHPFERWTQDQYYQMAAFFARIGFEPDPASGDRMVGGTSVRPATPLYEVVLVKSEGEVTHLRTGKEVPPAFPFQCEHDCDSEATRQQQLAAWITSADNPYFAKSYVNRIWAYLTGRGLIEPIDDMRAGNPATNPELLDWLTKQFVESGFDVQSLIRTICRSRTYQLALAANDFNEDDAINYSHAKARRLPAEVLYDAIYRTTGAHSNFPDVPQGTRAAALPDVGIELPDGFLNNLGRPARESSCECERSNQLQMGPIMALINGATVGQAVGDGENVIAQLVADESDDRHLVEKLFLRVLGRPAAVEEVADALALVDALDEQHRELAKELETYEQELEPILVQRERQRVLDLEQAKEKLAARETEAAPERRRLEQERLDKISAAQAELASVRAQLVEKMPAWETSMREGTIWEPLAPLVVNSTGNAVLRTLPDLSVSVQGPNGERGANRFFAPADLTGVTGVRIEALTDDQLPKRGPGREDDGNFVLTEFLLGTAPLDEVRLQPLDAEGTPALDVIRVVDAGATEFSPVKLQNAQADFSQANHPVAAAIDGVTDNNQGWAIAPEVGKEHVAVFETSDDYAASGVGLIRAELVHNFNSGKHSLGRFRIAITRSPRPLAVGPPSEIAALLALNPDARTSEQHTQLVEYYLGLDKGYADQVAKVAEAENPVPPDAEAERIKELVARLSQPLPIDAKLARLQRGVKLSEQQLGVRRLTAAQDIAWALINSPEFLYNH